MSIDILMPALSPTMEEGTLAKWLIKEGDKVQSGDLIAEIETDKATMEVEAIDDGVIGKILVKDGQESIKVNSPIAILLLEGEHLSDVSKVDVDSPIEKIKENNKTEDTYLTCMHYMLKNMKKSFNHSWKNLQAAYGHY